MTNNAIIGISMPLQESKVTKIVHTSQITYCVSITNSNWLMPFTQMAAYSENDMNS